MRTLLKLTWVELKLFIREPVSLVFTFALPLIFLFVMGGVFGNTPNPEVYRGVGPMDFYLPAYIGLVIASIGSVALPGHLTGYRERGVLRRLRATSISTWTLFGSQVFATFAIAIVGSALLFAVAVPVYGADLPKEPAFVAAAFVLGVLSFSAFGVMLGALLPTTRASQGLGMILFVVMMILSGGGPPREVMTDAMRLIGDLTPLRYVILLLQDPWLGFGWNFSSFFVVLGVLAGTTAISVRVFKWQ